MKLDRRAVVTLDVELVDGKGVVITDEVVVIDTLLEVLVEELLGGGTAIETGDELDDKEERTDDATSPVLL